MLTLSGQEQIIVIRLYLVLALLIPVPLGLAQDRKPEDAKEHDKQELNVAACKVKQSAQAKELALRSVGLKGHVAASAELVTLEADQTPFLADKLRGRKLWMVTVPDWSVEFKSAPPDVKDTYGRTLDIYVDPVTGHVLKLRTRWPKNVPQDRVEPDAKSAELAIAPERYHAFPSEPPPISFLEALEASLPWGAAALEAKQIGGLWVLWSNVDSEPRPMWIITLCGTTPMLAFHGDEPNDDLRIVVDPVKKRWVVASDSPYCVPLKEDQQLSAEDP